MIKSYVINKVKRFQAAAGSIWSQKEAKKIWSETGWKLGLDVKEVLALSDGWAQACLNNNTDKLDTACDQVLVRLAK